MKRAARKIRTQGMTLVELVVAILILSVAVLGTLTYQYHAVTRAKKAQVELTAMQLAQLLIEDWKSLGGQSAYRPENLNMGIEKVSHNGNDYKITINDFPLWIQLDHQDVHVDTGAGVTLREIRITVQWRSDYQDQEPQNGDPQYSTATYVRRDQAAG